MNMPGFTAKDSLLKTGTHYISVSQKTWSGVRTDHILPQAAYCGHIGQVCGGGTTYEVWDCSDGLETVSYYVAVGSC
jgi:hypothetical protein